MTACCATIGSELHARVARALQSLDPATVAAAAGGAGTALTEGGSSRRRRRPLAGGGAAQPGPLGADRGDASVAPRAGGTGAAASEHADHQHCACNSAACSDRPDRPQGAGSAEAQELYRQRYAMCRELPEEPSHFPIYWGWWRVSREFRVKPTAPRALLARADGATTILNSCCRRITATGRGNTMAGDFDRCCAAYRCGPRAYMSRATIGITPAVWQPRRQGVRTWRAWRRCSGCRGRPHQCDWRRSAAMEWAERLDHLGSRVHAMDISLLHRTYRREHRTVYRTRRRAGRLHTQ